MKFSHKSPIFQRLAILSLTFTNSFSYSPTHPGKSSPDYIVAYCGTASMSLLSKPYSIQIMKVLETRCLQRDMLAALDPMGRVPGQEGYDSLDSVSEMIMYACKYYMGLGYRIASSSEGSSDVAGSYIHKRSEPSTVVVRGYMIVRA